MSVHHPLAIACGEQVVHIEGAFAEEAVGALLLDLDELAQDDVHRGAAHGAVLLADGLLPLIGDELQHAAQVLQVEQRQAVVVAVLEHQGEHALLGVIQLQDAAQQHGAELADGGAQAGAGFLAEAEQFHGHALGHVRFAHLGVARFDLLVGGTGGRNAAEVALHIHEQGGHALQGKLLGEDLQGLGLAAARGAADEAVAVHGAQGHAHLAIGGHFAVVQRTAQQDAIALEGVASGDGGLEVGDGAHVQGSKSSGRSSARSGAPGLHINTDTHRFFGCVPLCVSRRCRRCVHEEGGLGAPLRS
jgi:hypothetical protein